MSIEIQVLDNKIIINSPNVRLSQQFIEKLRELGLDVEIVIPDVRCG